MDGTTADDLRAFEKRLTEVVNHLQPSMWKHRILLMFFICLTTVGAYNWLSDPQTAKITFCESLLNHIIFTFSCSILLSLFLLGIHKKIIASSIVTSRCRLVLSEYNMSCDDSGRLILKPRPLQ